MKKNIFRKKLDLTRQTITNMDSGEMIGIYGGSTIRDKPANSNPPTLDITCPTMIIKWPDTNHDTNHTT